MVELQNASPANREWGDTNMTRHTPLVTHQIHHWRHQQGENGDTNMTRHTPEDKLSTRSTEHSNVHICCGIFDLLNVIAGHDVQRTGFEGGVTTL